MSILDLYSDYGIAIAQEGDRHYQRNWVNVACPFCEGNPGYHLGYSLEGNYFNCFRCGSHSVNYTLRKLLSISGEEAGRLVQAYRIVSSRSVLHREPAVKINYQRFKLPTDTGPLQLQHKRYLESRGFDADRLEREYDLRAVGPVGRLDGINYCHRILAPIYWDGEMVSFQARDYTGRQKLRYRSCPQSREKVHYKHILYGRPELWQGVGICVEGITDVWRLGGHAFATFGIGYTVEQVRVIVNRFSAAISPQPFRKVFVAFDPDTQAQQRAKVLMKELRFRGVYVENVELDCDPADLSQAKANDLLKDLKIY